MTSAELKNLMLAYEIVGNDLDKRGCEKLADLTDKAMYRIAQNSAWQNVGDALQSTFIDPAIAAGQTAMNAANTVGQAASNAANAAGQFAQNWLTPQGLAAQSVQFLQDQLNKAVDTTVKQKIEAELQRRGVQPQSSTSTSATQQQNSVISELLNDAKQVHNSGGDGWTLINDVLAKNTFLSPASKQSLKQQWAQIAETLPKHTGSTPAASRTPTNTPSKLA